MEVKLDSDDWASNLRDHTVQLSSRYWGYEGLIQRCWDWNWTSNQRKKTWRIICVEVQIRSRRSSSGASSFMSNSSVNKPFGKERLNWNKMTFTFVQWEKCFSSWYTCIVGIDLRGKYCVLFVFYSTGGQCFWKNLRPVFIYWTVIHFIIVINAVWCPVFLRVYAAVCWSQCVSTALFHCTYTLWPPVYTHD